MAEAGKKRKVFDGRYEILSIVGRGSRSVVYHARSISNPATEVALKVHVSAKDKAMSTDRLRKEALAMVSSRHKYVIRLDDFHSMGDICYLSMEYAPEADLRKYVAKMGGKLSPVQAELFLLQAAEALAFIHQAGIVHRDIKPDNILVVSERALRIADFGVAVLPGEESSIPELQKGVGTMDYMAPEVLEGVEYTAKSDLYALGVTLYEMLSGVHPFANVPLLKQLEVRQKGGFPDLTSLVPQAPVYLASVIMQAMSYDAKDRFATAKDLIQTLLIGKSQGAAKAQPVEQKAQSPATPRPATVVERKMDVPDIRAQKRPEKVEPQVMQKPPHTPAAANPREVPIKESPTAHKPSMPAGVVQFPKSSPPSSAAPQSASKGTAHAAAPIPPSARPPAVTAPEAVQQQPGKSQPLAAKETDRSSAQSAADKILNFHGDSSKREYGKPAPQLSAPGDDRNKTQSTKEQQDQSPFRKPNQMNTPSKPRSEQQKSRESDPFPKEQQPIDPLRSKREVEASRKPTVLLEEGLLKGVREGGAAKKPAQKLEEKVTGNKAPTTMKLPRSRKNNLIFSAAIAVFLLLILPMASQEFNEFIRRHTGVNLAKVVFHQSAQEIEVPLLPSYEGGELSFPVLPAGVYTGTITGLIAGKRVPLSMISLAEHGTIAVILGMEGWSPRLIAIDDGVDAGGGGVKRLRVNSNGFVLDMTGQNIDGEIKGSFRNVVTGDEGEWDLKPVTTPPNAVS